ncbi:hypothetical protein F441_05703 [Phytophthora nicotianae CJ01A1]|uniref:GDT1 family protein n=6 Tax=Phytophthora nicotianae TaxID=4792 RepID=W2QFX9_PHYN3|nr:hypothetical protein PPTG_10293 [Phytophthora nicotianae INRA-310]ETI50825.1 hypothetical protein F443_05695 [Phytophthora nicotianae P1569]ETK90706.1 hypothetical protein L915_05557 [Phytophthora nicotianae]ETO79554.1 hypothetical protein F444_05747 [Phytophthora nicotianae P1976]ETP20604.1 hypothetical protein F441_05703 [Phytophthora nicotianae CJ01A1]ETP48524.1 hypothetical protein F442_05742 [Phytophthora nicotianae P10297]
MPRLFQLVATFSLLLFLVAAQPAEQQHGAQADAAVTPAPVANSAMRSTAFARADADHNGVVDQHEFAVFTDSIKNVLGPFLGTFPADAGAAAAAGWGTGARPKLRTGGPHKFWSGFVSGILTIWATEIGDKTFFIAAILSMKKDRVVVFAGAIGALIVMTVLSVVMGVVATKFLPPSLTHYLGGVLFVVFGVKMLYDAREMNAAGPSDELNEVEEELMGKKDDEDTENVEEGHAKLENTTDGMIKVFSQTFLMTFLAEWGDRSQIATVTLSATKDAFGVTLGAILGHSMCTGIAVVGGKFLATRISERTVTLVGGILFVLFALHSFITGPSVSE